MEKIPVPLAYLESSRTSGVGFCCSSVSTFIAIILGERKQNAWKIFEKIHFYNPGPETFGVTIPKSSGDPMSEKNYIKLSGNFYFDPVKKHILKKQGSSFTFVRHDRRFTHRPVTKDRRDKFDAMPIHLKPIAQDLFWDAE